MPEARVAALDVHLCPPRPCSSGRSPASFLRSIIGPWGIAALAAALRRPRGPRVGLVWWRHHGASRILAKTAGRSTPMPSSNRMNVPPERLEELREDFETVDEDQDGRIDFAEFASLMDNLNAQMTDTDLRIGFTEIDADHDGSISL